MHIPKDIFKQPLGELLRNSMVRYVLVGGSAYVIELLVIVVAQRAGAGNILAVALSFWVGLVYSFVLQKFFSFSDKRTHHKIIVPQLLMVSALVVFNFLFTIGITRLLEHALPAVVTRTLAIAMTTVWNFYLYKTRIFKTPVID